MPCANFCAAGRPLLKIGGRTPVPGQAFLSGGFHDRQECLSSSRWHNILWRCGRPLRRNWHKAYSCPAPIHDGQECPSPYAFNRAVRTLFLRPRRGHGLLSSIPRPALRKPRSETCLPPGCFHGIIWSHLGGAAGCRKIPGGPRPDTVCSIRCENRTSERDSRMGRVRTWEEVEEIKIREKIKLSLVRKQIILNRDLGRGGCATARGRVYITSIFQKNGQLSLRRPQLALRCMIRAHLNQADIRNGRRPGYDIILDEAEIREYCLSKEHKTKCHAYRRFVEEALSVIVKREPEDEPGTVKQDGSAPAQSVAPEPAAPEAVAPGAPPPEPAAPESPDVQSPAAD